MTAGPLRRCRFEKRACCLFAHARRRRRQPWRTDFDLKICLPTARALPFYKLKAATTRPLFRSLRGSTVISRLTITLWSVIAKAQPRYRSCLVASAISTRLSKPNNAIYCQLFAPPCRTGRSGRSQAKASSARNSVRGSDLALPETFGVATRLAVGPLSEAALRPRPLLGQAGQANRRRAPAARRTGDHDGHRSGRRALPASARPRGRHPGEIARSSTTCMRGSAVGLSSSTPHTAPSRHAGG